MAVQGYSSALQRVKIESFLDPEFIGVDNTFWPSKGDFVTTWEALSGPQRDVVAASISSANMGELMATTGKRPGYLMDYLKRQKNVGRAIMIARMCHLPSDKAREMYIAGFLGAQKSRAFYYDEVQKVIKTDKDHLVELASKLTTDGDGKREILKMLVAFGMQVKKVQDAVICPDTKVELEPMVIALAEPRIAFIALQELNRMDHEYGQDDKATSSIEGQADRVKRLALLADKLNVAAEKQAKVVGAVAQKVAARELKVFSTNDL